MFGFPLGIKADTPSVPYRFLHRAYHDADFEQSFRVIVDSSASDVFFAEPTDKKPAVIDELVREERARKVAAVLEKLPHDERTAVELHYLSEHSILQTADKMGKSSEEVTHLVRRGIRTLRTSLKDA